ncbi:FAD-dependent oxidoreductase [Methylocapsa sp. S129]|uniref:FAD-dependent oxidoreductase n=1 Tax=Methylocapsa sp. S129 TaxID=1641869 RepID=UPI00131DB1A3|nr:FAD-dependent oxidoreductase [Methylocapsa sp. S129]
MRVTVVGAGVVGLTAALELSERGAEVEIVERAAHLGEAACSWCAGGMLAPWCEGESAPAEVVDLGAQALDWWARRVPGVASNGTLVVAAPRDVGEIERFAARTLNHERVDETRIGALEPDLAGRFRKGLFFAREGHLDPRMALGALRDRLAERGVAISFGVDGAAPSLFAGAVLDCRGFAARDALEELRGVRGEMLILRTKEISLARPIRFLHPRIPLYVVPRADGLFMVGATMIESAERGSVTARSAIELLSAAYALHPAFGEAEIVEMRADVRPAFPDNLPRIVRRGATNYLNGFYRHGFLLSPAFAQKAAATILRDVRDTNENHRQRRRA